MDVLLCLCTTPRFVLLPRPYFLPSSLLRPPLHPLPLSLVLSNSLFLLLLHICSGGGIVSQKDDSIRNIYLFYSIWPPSSISPLPSPSLHYYPLYHFFPYSFIVTYRQGVMLKNLNSLSAPLLYPIYFLSSPWYTIALSMLCFPDYVSSTLAVPDSYRLFLHCLFITFLPYFLPLFPYDMSVCHLS
jgi:hypothetical protein